MQLVAGNLSGMNNAVSPLRAALLVTPEITPSLCGIEGVREFLLHEDPKKQQIALQRLPQLLRRQALPWQEALVQSVVPLLPALAHSESPGVRTATATALGALAQHIGCLEPASESSVGESPSKRRRPLPVDFGKDMPPRGQDATSPRAVLLATVLPLLKRLLCDRNADTANAAAEAFLLASRQLNESEFYERVLNHVLIMAHEDPCSPRSSSTPTSPANSVGKNLLMAGMKKLMGRQDKNDSDSSDDLADDLDEAALAVERRLRTIPLLSALSRQCSDDVCQHFLAKEFVAFSQEHSFRVRKQCAAHLGPLFARVSAQQRRERLLPVLCRLASDRLSVVREATVQALLPAVQSTCVTRRDDQLQIGQRNESLEDQSETLVPLVLQLCRDHSAMVRRAVLCQLGRIIWACDRRLRKRRLLVRVYARVASTQCVRRGRRDNAVDEKVLRNLAFCLPAVARAIGRRRFASCLRRCFRALSRHNSAAVRLPLAASLHELARVLERSCSVVQLLLPALRDFLQDVPRVKEAVLQSLSVTMTFLPPDAQRDIWLLVVSLVDAGRWWRCRSVVAKQLPQLLTLPGVLCAVQKTQVEPRVGGDVVDEDSDVEDSDSDSDSDSECEEVSVETTQEKRQIQISAFRAALNVVTRYARDAVCEIRECAPAALRQLARLEPMDETSDGEDTWTTRAVADLCHSRKHAHRQVGTRTCVLLLEDAPFVEYANAAAWRGLLERELPRIASDRVGAVRLPLARWLATNGPNGPDSGPDSGPDGQPSWRAQVLRHCVSRLRHADSDGTRCGDIREMLPAPNRPNRPSSSDDPNRPSSSDSQDSSQAPGTPSVQHEQDDSDSASAGAEDALDQEPALTTQTADSTDSDSSSSSDAW